MRTPFALAALVALAGCRREPTLLAVPLVRQAYAWSCGAAAVTSVLYYYGRFDGRETSLYPALGTNETDGTHPARIVAVLRSRGLRAELRQSVTLASVRDALARGEPVIVDLQAWTDDPAHVRWHDAWDDGHYVVAVGLDEHRLYVMDPSSAGRYAFVPLDELADRWHDFEDGDAGRVEYHRMAIFVAGTGAASRYPAPAVRMY